MSQGKSPMGQGMGGGGGFQGGESAMDEINRLNARVRELENQLGRE